MLEAGVEAASVISMMFLGPQDLTGERAFQDTGLIGASAQSCGQVERVIGAKSKVRGGGKCPR